MAQQSVADLEAWPERLRASGRSITWLAERLGVQRSYLSAIASGKRHPSPALRARIELELASRRIDDAGAYASGRVTFVDLRARCVEELEGAGIAPAIADDLADTLARVALRTVAGHLARSAER